MLSSISFSAGCSSMPWRISLVSQFMQRGPEARLPGAAAAAAVTAVAMADRRLGSFTAAHRYRMPWCTLSWYASMSAAAAPTAGGAGRGPMMSAEMPAEVAQPARSIFQSRNSSGEHAPSLSTGISLVASLRMIDELDVVLPCRACIRAFQAL